MCITRSESVPQTWDDDRDNAFFRITASVFSTEFVYGAGVLLSSNDPVDETDEVCRCDETVAAPVATELVPVRVRRGDVA